MTLPNAVIIGAPKCGTSSAFHWLVEHPDVGASDRKETFYLMDPSSPLIYGPTYAGGGLEGYARLFEGCSEPIVVDATSHYLYQSVAREVLAKLEPVPQVFVLLRKPSDRVYSSFQYTKYNRARVEPRFTFEAYVDAVLEGRSEEVDQYVHSPLSAYVLRNEVQYSQYADYLVSWRDRIPAGHLHVYLLEDIQQDPLTFVRDVCRILGIDPEFYATYDFAPENRTVQVRGLGIHRFALKWARRIPLGPMNAFLKQAYYNLQVSDPVRRTDEDHRARSRLDAHFAPHVKRLQQEIGIDLKPWGPQG